MDDEYLSKGDASDAAFLFTQAIHDGPPTAALYAERARAFIGTGDLVSAAADAFRAVQLDPTMPRAYLRTARACIGLKRYGDARAAVLAGAVLAPGDMRFAELMEELDGKKMVPEKRMTSSSQAGAEGATCDSGKLRKLINDMHGVPRPAHRRASSSVF
nr:protein SGT1 homolog [Lolium perenne]